MDGYYGNLGLFTIRSKIEVCLRYALSKGMEPVVRIVKSGESFIQIIVVMIYGGSSLISQGIIL